MEGLSNYAANKINDFLFGNVSYSVPATIYCALAKGTVSETDTGLTFDEADFGGYARVALTNNTTNFPNAAAGIKEVGVDVEFPTATSGSNTIVEFVFLDAASGGNIIAGGVLTVSQTVSTGQQLVLTAGEIAITVN